MPEFKEKPKMGQPKSKRSAMLDPRHRAVLLKEKYRQQMEQRQDTGAENAETQAVSRVESAAEWAADELRERVPQAPKKKPPVKFSYFTHISTVMAAPSSKCSLRYPPANSA